MKEIKIPKEFFDNPMFYSMNNLQVLNEEVKKYLSIPEIKTEEDYNKAGDSVAFLTKKVMLVEGMRKDEVAPLVAQKKKIDETYKSFTNPIEAIVTQIKTRMVNFAREKRETQKLLEAEIVKAAGDADEVFVDDVTVEKSKGEFSSSSVTSTTKYRFKNSKLNELIDIPPIKFKEFLKTNSMPEFIESYEEESIKVRKNF